MHTEVQKRMYRKYPGLPAVNRKEHNTQGQAYRNIAYKVLYFTCFLTTVESQRLTIFWRYSLSG